MIGSTDATLPILIILLHAESIVTQTEAFSYGTFHHIGSYIGIGITKLFATKQTAMIINHDRHFSEKA